MMLPTHFEADNARIFGTTVVLGGPTHEPLERHGRNIVSTSQTPIPERIAGGQSGGPEGKAPAEWFVAGIRRHDGFSYEHCPTIGSVSRQSYQYVRPSVPYPVPFNAFGNPSHSGELEQGGHQSIANKIRPPLLNQMYDFQQEDLETIRDTAREHLVLLGRY